MTASFQTDLTDVTCNGWTNYETWNVALWIQNDPSLYELVCEQGSCYQDFLGYLSDYTDGDVQTPDGVSFADPKVNVFELNDMISDF